MSEYDREIVESIRKAAGTSLKDDVQIIQACVTNVNTASAYTCDCTPISGNYTTPFKGVLLSASNNDSFILVPALQSTVLVAVSTKNNPPYVIGCDTLQGIICVVQNADNSLSKLLINYKGNNNIQLNDGSYGGLVQIQKLNDNLNKLIDYLNNLVTNIGTGLSNCQAGTSTAGATFQTAMQSFSNDLNLEDMENTKITHGV